MIGRAEGRAPALCGGFAPSRALRAVIACILLGRAALGRVCLERGPARHLERGGCGDGRFGLGGGGSRSFRKRRNHHRSHHVDLRVAVLEAEAAAADRDDVLVGEKVRLPIAPFVVEEGAERIGLAQVLDPHLPVLVGGQSRLHLGHFGQPDLDVALLRVAADEEHVVLHLAHSTLFARLLEHDEVAEGRLVGDHHCGVDAGGVRGTGELKANRLPRRIERFK